MDDYIKREDAIDYLTTNMNWFDADGIETSEEEKRADITELVNGVSSADVAPVRHGHWFQDAIYYGEDGSPCIVDICTECGAYGYYADFNYCPNCGAKMYKENDND